MDPVLSVLRFFQHNQSINKVKSCRGQEEEKSVCRRDVEKSRQGKRLRIGETGRLTGQLESRQTHGHSRMENSAIRGYLRLPVLNLNPSKLMSEVTIWTPVLGLVSMQMNVFRSHRQEGSCEQMSL